jgi:hypothetical protein
VAGVTTASNCKTTVSILYSTLTMSVVCLLITTRIKVSPTLTTSCHISGFDIGDSEWYMYAVHPKRNQLSKKLVKKGI